MTITVTETGPFERLVRFQLTDEEIRAGKPATARKLSQDMKLAGFRQGRAPAPVVEAAVGPERFRSEVIDDLVPSALTRILDDEELRPAVRPQLESLDDIEGGVEVEVRVTLWPQIDLPEFRDRKIEVMSPEVSQQELDEQVTRMLEQFGTVEEVDRTGEEGDFVSVDVEAWLAGESVDEAKASDLLYEIGSGLFIEGLDDHLVGVSAGDVVELEAPLPSGFGDMAGTEVSFKITVHEVKERVLPEMTDEWVDDNTEFDTVDEMIAELNERLEDAKRRAASRQYAERALSTLVDQVDVELPEALVRAEMDDQLHSLAHRLEDSDITLDDYFRATGQDQDEFLADLRLQAERSLRNQLVLEAVAREEGITVTDDDISKVVQAYGAQTEDPVRYLQAFQQSGQELAVASDILRNKALDAILSHASPVDEDGNPVLLRPEESLEESAVEAEVVEAEIVAAEEAAGVEVVEAEVLEEEE